MVGSASGQAQFGKKPRRRNNSGLILLMMVVFLAAGALMFIGFLAPTRLAMPQEQLLGLMHGGIASVDDQVQVQCVLDPATGTQQAITRTQRTTTFRDNTSMSMIFNTSPAPTNLACTSPSS